MTWLIDERWSFLRRRQYASSSLLFLSRHRIVPSVIGTGSLFALPSRGEQNGSNIAR